MKLILSAALCFLALGACSKSEEKTIAVKEAEDNNSTAIAPVTPGKVFSDKTKFTVKSDDGKVTMEQNGAAKFSDEAPQYPGSTITSTMRSTSDDGKTSGAVEMETGDSPADVIAFYKAKMTAAKRTILNEMSSPETGLIMSIDDRGNLTVDAKRRNDKTVVTIITSKGF
jgi:hypothetical protein